MPLHKDLGKGSKMRVSARFLTSTTRKMVVSSTEIINLRGGTGFVREDSCRRYKCEFSVGHPKVESSSRQTDTQVQSSDKKSGLES